MAEDTRSRAAPSLVSGADIRTFLFADMRGYTRFTHEHGDDEASALAAWFAGLVRDAIGAFDGELLELRGDEALCVFASARQALRAATEVQRQLRTPDSEDEAFPLGVGIGLDAGEAVRTEGGFRGGALNVASRLCGAAASGEILVTERLVGLTGRVPGMHWGRAQTMSLKGLTEPQSVVRVHPDDPLPPPPTPPPAPRRHRRRLIAGGVVALAVAVLVTVDAVSRGGNNASAVATPPRSLAVIDLSANRVVGDVRLTGSPESAAVGFGRIWVGEQGGTVSAVGISNLRPQRSPLGVGIDPASLAAGAGAVWVFDDSAHLVEIDPTVNPLSVIGQRRLWRCTNNHFANPNLPQCGGGGIVLVGHEVWVGHALGGSSDAHNGIVSRINTETLMTAGHIRHVAIGVLGEGEGGVWSFGDVGREVDRIDVATGQILHVPLGGQIATYTATGLTVGFGYGWVPSPTGVLYRVSTDGTVTDFELPAGLTDVAASPASLWVSTNTGRVLQVNPFTGRVAHTYKFGRSDVVALVYTDHRVWAALAPP